MKQLLPIRRSWIGLKMFPFRWIDEKCCFNRSYWYVFSYF